MNNKAPPIIIRENWVLSTLLKNSAMAWKIALEDLPLAASKRVIRPKKKAKNSIKLIILALIKPVLK
jgi:hypothetical protein